MQRNRPIPLLSLIVWPLLTLACASQAAATTVYHGLGWAYVVDWSTPTRRADVVHGHGRSGGQLSQAPNLRTVTLDSPYTYRLPGDLDDCGEYREIERRVERLAFKVLAGTTGRGRSEVQEQGTATVRGGCHDGASQPFGLPGEAVQATAHLPLSARASIKDIQPGVSLAGLHEGPGEGIALITTPADLATWTRQGRLRFAGSGQSYPVALGADGWLRVSLPTGTRAYLRLSRDAATGEERWLMGSDAAGQLQNVTSWWVIRAQADASFGDPLAAARRWENGLNVGTPTPFFHDLFQDGSAELVSVDETGTETRQTGLSWSLDGRILKQSLSTPSQPVLKERLRQWRPVRNAGDARWVLYRYDHLYQDGTSRIVIPQRTMFYVDRGATPWPRTAVTRP